MLARDVKSTSLQNVQILIPKFANPHANQPLNAAIIATCNVTTPLNLTNVTNHVLHHTIYVRIRVNPPANTQAHTLRAVNNAPTNAPTRGALRRVPKCANCVPWTVIFIVHTRNESAARYAVLNAILCVSKGVSKYSNADINAHPNVARYVLMSSNVLNAVIKIKTKMNIY